MINVLSIGNSFSQDAQRYLHRLAKADGELIRSANLYIGGCPLEKHYLNMLDDDKAYDFEFNGDGTGLKVSIREGLRSNKWDVITLQQASRFSPEYQTWHPYLGALADYIRKYCPHAKIYMHQTWAYEQDSQRLVDAGFSSAQEMTDLIVENYNKAQELIKADGIIKCGEGMMELYKKLGKAHRDGLHASLGAGRYLLALTWYKTITGKDITANNFNDFDEPVTEEERKAVIEIVNSLVK